MLDGRDFTGAGAAAGVRGVPVGELIAGLGEVGAKDAKVFVGEIAQPPGDIGVGRLAEPVVEVGGGGEDVLQRGEDAVVGGGQLGQCLGAWSVVVASRRRSATWAMEVPSGR